MKQNLVLIDNDDGNGDDENYECDENYLVCGYSLAKSNLSIVQTLHLVAVPACHNLALKGNDDDEHHGDDKW